MQFFTKESLENLKQRVDIVDVISGYIELKRTGTYYKGLCPFHDEKTPSFQVTKNRGVYHCFGCGVHGDVISFLMQYVRLSFSEAVETLAQRYQVILEKTEGEEQDKYDKRAIKYALEKVSDLYHMLLLQTPQGHIACDYLFQRGIDLSFIERFQIGYSCLDATVLLQVMQQLNISEKTLREAGVLSESSSVKDCFLDRITFPIRDSLGAVIGFSARKFKETTKGGKYVNTSETPIFKKNRILFGLDSSRRRIAKEKRAVIVEGQIDALRLIYHGLDITVASQGTAFGENQCKELISLGVKEIYLAFDRDKAGLEATCKIGDLFLKEGIAVKVILLPLESDPDSFVLQYGIQSFLHYMQIAQDYLDFLISYLSEQFNTSTPVGKNALVRQLTQQIQQWKDSVLIHESLRYVAQRLQLPEEVVGTLGISPNQVFIKKTAFAGLMEVDADKVLETDLIRWLVVTGPHRPEFIKLARLNIDSSYIQVAACRIAYETCLKLSCESHVCDLLTLAASLEVETRASLIDDLMQRRIPLDRAEEMFRLTLQKILEREWMRKRESLRVKIQSGSCSEEEALNLLKEFDFLKKTPPCIVELEVGHGDGALNSI